MHDVDPDLLSRLAKIRVVLADIDGTLFRSPADTLEHVARHIRKLLRTGIRFSVATGRAIAGVQLVVRRLETEHGQWAGRRWTMPVVAYNGAVVAIPSEPMVLDRLVISCQAVNATIDEALRGGCMALAYVCRQPFDLLYTEKVYGYTCASNRPATEFNGMIVDWDAGRGADLKDVVALLVADPLASGNLPSIAANLGGRQLDIRVTTSGGPYLEVTSVSNSKLRGMRTLAQRLRCETDEIMAIGDNLNDLEMLDHAGFSVAVSNAPDEVKRRVSYVSALTAGEGVVDSLRLLLEYRRATVRSARLLGEQDVRFRR